MKNVKLHVHSVGPIHSLILSFTKKTSDQNYL